MFTVVAIPAEDGGIAGAGKRHRPALAGLLTVPVLTSFICWVHTELNSPEARPDGGASTIRVTTYTAIFPDVINFGVVRRKEDHL
jgi:hypothetical protein